MPELDMKRPVSLFAAPCTICKEYRFHKKGCKQIMGGG